MDGTVIRLTLSLIAPSLFSVFAIAFVCTWLVEKKRPYLLLLAAGCGMFALGSASQILYWPRDTGVNALVSGTIYTCAVIAVSEGVLWRSGKSSKMLTNLALVLTVSGLLWYFFYVDRSLIARVYIQNFGYGLILLIAAIRLAELRKGRIADRILFWTLFLFAIQFFPRTVLTIGFSAPAGAKAFGNSVFWQALQLSMAVLGSSLAFAIIGAAISDLIDDLRRERDSDHLTRVLNRRGFEAALEARRMRHGSRASLVVCDVDRFKAINDSHGHAVGDRVLERVATILRTFSDADDPVGRIGGEEFAIYLAGASGAEAYDCAERLREAIAQTDFSDLGLSRPVTASFGIASTAGGPWGDLYKEADGWLYKAKNAGRNRTLPSSLHGVSDDPLRLPA
jgi:diguanylate cyclase (GGDEF)-like protein